MAEDADMNNELPEPLVPAEVDLRDFSYMPLDVRTLLSSSLWIKAKRDPRVAHAAMSLWCEAWHQVPCASLPDDDEVLADLARCEPKEWARVRERALQQFVKCSDGRLYHRTVAVKALESWEAKVARRARTKAATDAREAKARAAHAHRDGDRDDARNDARDVDRDDGRDGDRHVHQGKGREGKGIEGKEGIQAATPPARKRAPAPQTVSAADMEAEGVQRQHAVDWLAVRKAKNLPLTPTAWADTKAEAEKAHVSIAEAIKASASNGWGGFRASWLHGKDVPLNGASRPINRQLAVEAENQRVLGEWLGKQPEAIPQ
jgi:hypothetical protein